MATVTNRALEAFVSHIGNELVLAQVLISRAGTSYELRHVADRGSPATALRSVQLSDLRALAQFTGEGAFRPLKSAPNLQSGWRLVVGNSSELEGAINQIYPGAIADWNAAQSATPPITHYRECANRQSGMYRITAMLDDTQVGQLARACCHNRFCLKRRLWTVTGLATDPAAEKSLIPCLEPCAVLLEFARNVMRIEQEDKIQVELAPGDVATLRAALHLALANPNAALREADFNSPSNPRRLLRVFEKLASLPEPPKMNEENETKV
jgi:hypothetical protein